MILVLCGFLYISDVFVRFLISPPKTYIQTEMMKKINRILVEVVHTNRRLDALENRPDVNSNVKTGIIEENFSFNQMGSPEEFENFDKSLVEDALFTRMKGFLKLKGGNNLYEIMKNIFKAYVKDEVLSEYSWKGAREKKEFRNFKSVDLIIAVVRCHLQIETDDFIKKRISKWLIQAPTRMQRAAVKNFETDRGNEKTKSKTRKQKKRNEIDNDMTDQDTTDDTSEKENEQEAANENRKAKPDRAAKLKYCKAKEGGLH